MIKDWLIGSYDLFSTNKKIMIPNRPQKFVVDVVVVSMDRSVGVMNHEAEIRSSGGFTA